VVLVNSSDTSTYCASVKHVTGAEKGRTRRLIPVLLSHIIDFKQRNGFDDRVMTVYPLYLVWR